MKKKSIGFAIALLFLILVYSGVLAGSSLDIGTVPGTPPIGQVNWIAWLNKNIQPGGYPNEIITEDSTNAGTGINQGYQPFGGQIRWLLQVVQFSNESSNDAVSILLGGLGASSGNGWSSSFNWVTSQSITDHGIATVVPGFSACPVMGSGSQDASGKTINWSGVSSEYLVYRSQLPSPAGNGYSNGRYQYAATIQSGIFTYLDAACPTGTQCWHIVVPSTNGTITGCHSEESSPTAITLTQFTASNTPSTPIALAAGVGVSLLAFASLGMIWKRRRI